MCKLLSSSGAYRVGDVGRSAGSSCCSGCLDSLSLHSSSNSCVRERQPMRNCNNLNAANPQYCSGCLDALRLHSSSNSCVRGAA